MKRHIYLADMPHIETPSHKEYSRALLATARAALEAKRLRFDNATGIIRDNSGELERFSNPADHVPAESLEEIMEWQFRRYINNSASRISRGYEP